MAQKELVALEQEENVIRENCNISVTLKTHKCNKTVKQLKSS